MAGCEEAREGSRKRRVREFVASWFMERCLAKDEQEASSINLGKRLSSEFMMPLKEKANLVAVDGELSGAATAICKIQKEKMDNAKHAAVDKIQAEKMDKAVVEVVDGEKNGFSAVTEKMDKCAESDHVSTDDLTELAKLLNKSEDWIEKKRKQDRDNTARSKRISDHFVQFCVNQQQGCLKEEESDEEDDDEYDARFARMEKFTGEFWSQHSDFSGLDDHYNPEEDNMVAA